MASSVTVKIRNRLARANGSWAKSSGQRTFGAVPVKSCTHVPAAIVAQADGAPVAALFPPPPLAPAERFPAVEPPGLLAVHHVALAPEQNVPPPAAEPAPSGRQRSTRQAQRRS